LLYERKTLTDFRSDDEKEGDKTISELNVPIFMDTVMTLRGNNTGHGIHLSSDIEQKILLKNKKYWQKRFLFGEEYRDFVYDLSVKWNTSCYIPRKFLTKNNDFQLENQDCPEEYLGDLSLGGTNDLKITIDESLVPELELRVFKYATCCYLTILNHDTNRYLHIE
jgi:hypothetical protein